MPAAEALGAILPPTHPIMGELHRLAEANMSESARRQRLELQRLQEVRLAGSAFCVCIDAACFWQQSAGSDLRSQWGTKRLCIYVCIACAWINQLCQLHHTCFAMNSILQPVASLALVYSFHGDTHAICVRVRTVHLHSDERLLRFPGLYVFSAMHDASKLGAHCW